ncbi:MAG: cupin domain-containing protein [Chloroflexi bacterium]|nr:cupin domain-containing protein [Chloroflexota bacterium]
MSVKHISDIESTAIKDGTGVTRKMLISAEEAPNFAMRCFTIQPGGRMPNHINQVEHEQFVLNGHGKVKIGDEVFEVQKGDIVFIPAGIPHWYTNIGEEPFEFLCLVPDKPDSTTILEC